MSCSSCGSVQDMSRNCHGGFDSSEQLLPASSKRPYQCIAGIDGRSLRGAVALVVAAGGFPCTHLTLLQQLQAANASAVIVGSEAGKAVSEIGCRYSVGLTQKDIACSGYTLIPKFKGSKRVAAGPCCVPTYVIW